MFNYFKLIGLLAFFVLIFGCSTSKSTIENDSLSLLVNKNITIDRYEYYSIPPAAGVPDPIIIPTIWYHLADTYYTFTLNENLGTPVNQFKNDLAKFINDKSPIENQTIWALVEINNNLAKNKLIQYTPLLSQASELEQYKLTILIYNDFDPLSFYMGEFFSIINYLESQVTWRIYDKSNKLVHETRTQIKIKNPVEESSQENAKKDLIVLYSRHTNLFIQELNKPLINKK